MRYATLMLATATGLHTQAPPQFDVASAKPSAPAAAAAPGSEQTVCVESRASVTS